MAFAANYYVWLFGGTDGVTDFDDLWRWDGASWAEITPLNAGPSARRGAAAVYDRRSGAARLVIIGGYEEGGGYLSDVWSYDPDTNMWDVVNTHADMSGLDGRAHHSAAFFDNGNFSKIIIHGGEGASGLLDATVVLDLFDSTTVETAATVAGVREGTRMAFDLFNDQMYIHGGERGGTYRGDMLYEVFNDVWASQRLTGPPPPGRAWHGLATTADEGFLIFGGKSAGTVEPHLDEINTWGGIIDQPIQWTPQAYGLVSPMWSITSQPAWLNVNATTGEFTGTPTSGDVAATNSGVLCAADKGEDWCTDNIFAVVAPAPAAYWDFDDANVTAGPVLADVQGNSDLTAEGSVTTGMTGLITGESFVFDGNDRLVMGNVPGSYPEITFVATISFASVTGMQPIATHLGTEANRGWSLFVQDGYLYASAGDGTTTYQTPLDTRLAVEVGTVYRVGIRVESAPPSSFNQVFVMLLNGRGSTKRVMTEPMVLATGPLELGASTKDGTFLSGTMDEATLWFDAQSTIGAAMEMLAWRAKEGMRVIP